MLKRHDLVKRILELSSDTQTPDLVSAMWFQDIRKNGGWRLTQAGLSALRAANIQHWSVPLDSKKITKKLLLEMNKKIHWPYFISIKPPSLILFNDHDAVMAQLHGDPVSWITKQIT
jgi:hypothetical protein